MDFYEIGVKVPKEGPPQLYPDWVVGRSKDLMVRGGSFYAIWDDKAGLWSKDEYDVQRLVDEEIHLHNQQQGGKFAVRSLKSFNTNEWATWRRFLHHVSDNSQPLDETLIFANTDVKKSDYASQRLNYSLAAGDFSAWDELVEVLYSPEERAKIEWAIGAIVAGDAKKIQKFLVFYGSHGTGKSTVLNIIQKLFDGYTTTFDAKALGSGNNQFATEAFRHNPLVAIQHDGDLSKIDDNTRLNSIISHEEMPMNEKYKPAYTSRVNAFLFMGTNQPVKISDAKSGIIRRLIDVHPTGARIPPARYEELMLQIDFQLGALAQHCLDVYNDMGKNYYNSYRPLEMMLQTDVFYNYVEYFFSIFHQQNGVSLKQAYDLYKEFCAETGIDKLMPRHRFREELRNYFDEFHDRKAVNGEMIRSYYEGFKPLTPPDSFVPNPTYSIHLEEGLESSFDRNCKDQYAQYASASGYPAKKWIEVETTLGDLDTSKLHYVKLTEQHVVIDFDLKDEAGEKNLELNLAAANKWPATYTEASQSGQGIHLHYVYSGDVTELASVFDDGIEVKTLLGGSALRRKLSVCNNLDFATISSGLPKKERPMIDDKTIKSEKGLRSLIDRNLRKEIHPGTKSSIDFIHKILEEAYETGMVYDVTDLKGTLISFAAGSTHQAGESIRTVQKMKFKSENDEAAVTHDGNTDDPIVFFDVEVYPNLLVVCWKYRGVDNDVAVMINPTAEEIAPLLSLKLVGFFNRNYDNHIIYARYLGYTLEELYQLSDKLVNGDGRGVKFGEAYDISYADIYDFAMKKQGLKKWQIDLGIYHMEMELPWNEPVPEDRWQDIAKYCCNDVLSTEAVFEDRIQDFVARQFLAELSGLSLNSSTQQHTAKIVFAGERKPQFVFKYTDLSKEFPGYKFELGKSTYRGEDPSEGGYVYAEPGMYENVAVLDVASMHPTSTVQLDLFGPYTPNFNDLIQARLAIKRNDTEAIKTLLGGKLAPFAVGNEEELKALSYALKIAINIVYGLTSAKFPNPFKDNRNVDNIVAKRGALFMIDLKHFVQERGFQVVHIKTDSIKIPDATPEIIEAVAEFGVKYGYEFEHEATYDRFCLVNDAVYIARETLEKETDRGEAYTEAKWTAVGAQFQHPYVYKTLFTKEEITFDDLCETKHVVKGVMYLDFTEEGAPENLMHVGKTGSFVPVVRDGGVLYRIQTVDEEEKRYAVVGTKGWRWVQREMALNRSQPWSAYVDMSYFDKLKADAEDAIDMYGSLKTFLS